MRAPSGYLPAAARRPEAALLLACARTGRDAPCAGYLRTLLQPDLDWSWLLHTALRHGVMPLLYWHLHTGCPDAVPPATMAQLQQHFLANLGQNLMLTTELLQLLRLLQQHAIPVIPYKGPVLAVLAYGSVAFRQFADLDLLIHPHDAAHAQALLQTHGYQPIPTQQLTWEAHFLREDCLVQLDLHWQITPQTTRGSSIAFSLPLADVWARVEPVALADTTVAHFAVADALLIRCQDAVKEFFFDRWPQLQWISDVAALTHRLQDAEWITVLHRARQCGSGRAVLLCLALAGALLGTRLPAAVQHSIRRDRQVQHLTREACHRLFRAADRPNPYRNGRGARWRRHRVCLRFQERVGDKGAYLLTQVAPYVQVLTPNAQDRAWWPLPGWLSPLYVLVRILRVGWVYGPKLARSIWPSERARASNGHKH